MDQTEHLQQLIQQLEQCAGDFSRRTNGQCSFATPNPKNRNQYTVSIRYDGFTCHFQYTSRAVFSTANSILELLITPENAAHEFAIPFLYFSDACNTDPLTPLLIPLITSQKGMREAFAAIESVLLPMLPEIQRICADPVASEQLVLDCHKEYLWLMGVPEKSAVYHTPETDFTAAYYRFITAHFAGAPYLNLLAGRDAEAEKQLRKLKKPFRYEKRLLQQLQQKKREVPAQKAFPVLEEAAENAACFNKNGVAKTNWKEFFSLFLSWMILSLLITPLFGGFFYLLMKIEGRDSIYLMGPSNSILYCILFALVVSISLSYFTRHFFYRLLNRNEHARVQYEAMDSIQNTASSDKLMKGFLLVLLTASIVGCMLLVKWNVNFKEQGFVDNTAFLSLQGDYHPYSEIECLYYRPDRVNGLGETIPFPSYVIRLKDGTEIDLYEYDKIENYTALLLKLQEKGVPVTGTAEP